MAEETNINTNKSWWQRKRVHAFAIILILLTLAGTGIWWKYYRSFVSTNDSRIATNILRVAPVNVGGRIEKVYVEEGNLVKKGQLLVEIDHRLPEAQYKKALAKYDLANLEYQRVQKLYEQSVAPLKDLDNTRTNLNIAEAELRLTQVALESTYLKSPIDGIVIQKIAEPGNNLEPGQVAVIISDVDNAWVNANIEETFIGRVKIGQPVYINIDEGGKLTGHVQEILAATAAQFSLLPAENAAGNYTKVVQKIPVKIALDPHPKQNLLRAGQSVTIKIKVL